MIEEPVPPELSPEESYRMRLERATHGLPTAPTTPPGTAADADLEPIAIHRPLRVRLVRDAGTALVAITLLAVALWPSAPDGGVLGSQASPGPSHASGLEGTATTPPPDRSPEPSPTP